MKRSVEDYIDLPYKKEIIKYPDGGYFIEVKELPGCMSEGDTVEEAFEMIEDAMRAWIETALEYNKTIPIPDVMRKNQYNGKVLVRMPAMLHKSIAEEAKANGVSINTYIVTMLSEKNSLNKIINALKGLPEESEEIEDNSPLNKKEFKTVLKFNRFKENLYTKNAV